MAEQEPESNRNSPGHIDWNRCPSCGQDGVEAYQTRWNRRHMHPCRFCGQTFFVSVVKKWWPLFLLVIIIFAYIVIDASHETYE
jgi:hypothetical protein